MIHFWNINVTMFVVSSIASLLAFITKSNNPMHLFQTVTGDAHYMQSRLSILIIVNTSSIRSTKTSQSKKIQSFENDPILRQGRSLFWQLKAVGCTAMELRTNDFSAQNMKDANFPASQLLNIVQLKCIL